jgi:hypothetical protein
MSGFISANSLLGLWALESDGIDDSIYGILLTFLAGPRNVVLPLAVRPDGNNACSNVQNALVSALDVSLYDNNMVPRRVFFARLSAMFAIQ